MTMLGHTMAGAAARPTSETLRIIGADYRRKPVLVCRQEVSMLAPSVRNFMLQQGFAEEPADACNMRFEGLYFQPRIVFALVLVGVVFQQPAIFIALAVVLFWNVAFPALNPFEVIYNRWIALPRGRQPLTPAPAPRRFAQAVNGLFNLASGLLLLQGLATASRIVQALLVIAFSLLLFARFCLGAYVFHLLRGEVAFANSTLPWARGAR